MPKNTILITISITKEQHEEGKKLSKEFFGKENFSGYVGYLIKEKSRASTG